MIKRTWDYESKALARQMFANFIIKHKKDLTVDLKDATYVCLPGYDEYSKNSLEIEQVCDKVGIKRENIVGIEQNKKIYKELEEADLGIELFCGTDYEYFQRTNEKFDIVSLDYTGQFNREAFIALRTLFKKQVLKEKSILYTNFYGARESIYTKDMYKQRAAEFLSESVLTDIFNKNNIENKMKQITNAELKKNRDEEITRVIISLAHGGKSLNRNFVVEMAQQDKDFMKALDIIKEKLESIDFTRFNDLEKYTDIIPIEKFGEDGSFFYLYQLLLKQNLFFIYKLEKDLEEQGFSFEELSGISEYFFTKQSYTYFCEDSKRNIYRNTANQMMLGDMFLFNQKREEFKLPIEIKYLEDSNKFCLNGKIVSQPLKGKKIFNDIKNVIENNFIWKMKGNLSPRKDLGSSFKPKATKEKLREEILKGTPEEEIYEKFRDVNPRTIAAIKAHKTMGTYNK